MVKALEVCGEMVGDGVELNIITYSTLIDGYCKAKNMEGAMGLYTEMVIVKANSWDPKYVIVKIIH
ncbi:pentatricopeptide repeat (PPR) superfamily protein [Artemisia annua]|uniref:Pentatricopeptide repeat (PPR) superfamily protein n=1 Tax=Artemisia annua TaxID=35608 RepID=A0A2U1NTW4_ARTAN|nr:pentatricopeptide repeat (PPR) superfamily protein [Artemisia annua]